MKIPGVLRDLAFHLDQGGGGSEYICDNLFCPARHWPECPHSAEERKAALQFLTDMGMPTGFGVFGSYTSDPEERLLRIHKRVAFLFFAAEVYHACI